MSYRSCLLIKVNPQSLSYEYMIHRVIGNWGIDDDNSSIIGEDCYFCCQGRLASAIPLQHQQHEAKPNTITITEDVVYFLTSTFD
jgi:hypothetical protein